MIEKAHIEIANQKGLKMHPPLQNKTTTAVKQIHVCLFIQLERKEKASRASHQDADRMSSAVTVEEQGVHKSGYNDLASEQYATKVTSQSRSQPKEEKKETDQEKIKVGCSKSLESSEFSIVSKCDVIILPIFSFKP